MRKQQLEGLLARGACVRKNLILAMGLVTFLATLSFASPALAKKSAFRVFSQCPLANPLVDENGCLTAISGGESEFTAGKVSVPLTKPITLNLGFHEKEVEPEYLEIWGSEFDSKTMTKVAQEIPGGLTAEVDPALLSPSELARYEKFVSEGKTRVTATVELAGSTAPTGLKLNIGAFLSEEGTALVVPTQVKLSNPFLGPTCYVGSNNNPIIVNTLTGTTSPPEGIEPIKGHPGTLSTTEEGEILVVSGARLVDNTFAVPGVTACGKEGGADAAIDAGAGLPSPAGHNSVVLEGNMWLAAAESVKEHLHR